MSIDRYDRGAIDGGDASPVIPLGHSMFYVEVGDGERLYFRCYKPMSYIRGKAIMHLRGQPRGSITTYSGEDASLGSFATRHGRMIIAPWYDTIKWPGGQRYGRGGVTIDDDPQLKSQMMLSFVTDVIGKVTELEKIKKLDVILSGQSAGAEFLSRLGAFFSEQLPYRFVLMNFVQPTFPDQTMPWSWGLDNLPTRLGGNAVLRKWLAADFTIYAGENDDFDTSQTTKDLQGETAYIRHINMYLAGKDRAEAEGWAFNWRFVTGIEASHFLNSMMNNVNADEAFFGTGTETPVSP